MNSAYATALKLLTLGYSVIPSGGGDKRKAPLVNWQEFQDVAPSKGQLETWEGQLKPHLWGIITNYRIAVIDADTLETRAQLEAELGEPHVVTPRGGAHWYIDTSRHPMKTVAGLLPGIDVRAVGGFVNVMGTRLAYTDKGVEYPTADYIMNKLPVLDELIPWRKLPNRILAALNGSKPASRAKQGTPIPDKTRNATLTSIAGALRRKGADQSAIEAALLEVNTNQCKPPLSAREVLRIAGSVSRYEPVISAANKPGFNDTDTGNAERFAAMYGDNVRFIEEYNCYAVYTGKYWRVDCSGNAILALSKEVARSYYEDAARETDDNHRTVIVRHAKQSHSQYRRKAMIELLKSEPGISIKIGGFDNDLYLLNCRNGTVDLTTGELQPHNKADMITKIIELDYNPDASSEVWQRFLESTFQGNVSLIDYCQRSLGYSCTASIATMACFLPYGQGWNGKSTLLGAVGDTLGADYSTEVDPAAFMLSQNDRGAGPNESIASLYKMRFVRSTEIKDGQKLSTDIIKRATGGETLRHNRKYQHEFTFVPTFKLWLSGNHRAIITDSTDSIWLRLRQIPFNANFRPGQPGFIPNLRQILKQAEHQQAILAWLIRGAVAWFAAGQQLYEPEDVLRATLDYRQDQDILADFLAEKCQVDKSAIIVKKELWEAYKSWTEENDSYRLGQRTFYERLKEKGITDDRGTANKAIFRGIRFLTPGEDSYFSYSSYFQTQKTLYEEIATIFPENKVTVLTTVTNGELPDCPVCGCSKWTDSPDGKLLCPCGYSPPRGEQ
ncbi:phage/plasmid primase, P4 family [Chloroflexota bacterium]